MAPLLCDPVTGTGSTRRILIADDYPDSASSLALLLDIDGFETETVADGTGVLPATARFVPDVVVMELSLPGCDGEEVARGLLTLPPERRPRVIVASGYGDAARRSRLTGLGVDAYLVKPADPEELLARVREACNRASVR